jgi:hypothetical protein
MPQLEARFMMVGFEGCQEWRRCLFYDRGDGHYRSAETVVLPPLPEGTGDVWIEELIIRDPGTGREWRCPLDPSKAIVESPGVRGSR